MLCGLQEVLFTARLYIPNLRPQLCFLLAYCPDCLPVALIPPSCFDDEKEAQDNKEYTCAKIEQTNQKLHDNKTDRREG